MSVHHTPGPYEAESETTKGAWVKGGDGNWICLTLGETDEVALANKAFILKALGNHDQLVAALDYVLERTWLDQHGEPQFKHGYDPQRVVDALAAAGVTYG